MDWKSGSFTLVKTSQELQKLFSCIRGKNQHYMYVLELGFILLRYLFYWDNYYLSTWNTTILLCTALFRNIGSFISLRHFGLSPIADPCLGTNILLRIMEWLDWKVWTQRQTREQITSKGRPIFIKSPSNYFETKTKSESRFQFWFQIISTLTTGGELSKIIF